jgi:hypothetical protein
VQIFIAPHVTIKNHSSIKNKCFRLFQNYSKNIEILKVGTHGNTSLAHIVHQKNHIFVTSENTYMVSKGIFHWFLLSSKIPCHLQLMSHATTCATRLLKH